MSHYDIEIKGHPPIDWRLLGEQRDRLTYLLSYAPGRPMLIRQGDLDAIKGVGNLLDAMIDTHDRGAS